MSGYSKILYTLAGKAGLVEPGNKEDPFHQLMYGLTGKTSTKELTKQEAKLVEDEILKRSAVPGMVSPAQEKYIRNLMYKLRDKDIKKSNATLNERLAGIVRRELKITADAKDPLLWVSSQNASKLIEILKKYVTNAEKKRKRSLEAENEDG